MMGVTVVFGGSGRLGEHVVRAMAGSGPVRFTYHSQREGADRLNAALAAQGHDVAAAQCDVRDYADVERVYDWAAKAGTVTGAVGVNGSMYSVEPLWELDDAEFRSVIDIDVIGTFNIMKAGVPRMAQTGGGAFVIYLTAAMNRTPKNNGLSTVPKSAAAMLIKQLARDAGPLNIRANGVAPGVMNTSKAIDIPSLPDTKRELVQGFLANTPLGRPADPLLAAELTQFLLSDVARDLSGQIISVDGGYSA
jgi:3-oxoacyl-[acyl-carrier protein] reductase